ncbi:MAG: hypothetical protein L3K26_14645 [Candidatus Hydrogenedentes bacterium]|nr:hypothetical protein [Candidatus Hydrogenedentota bacterium]
MNQENKKEIIVAGVLGTVLVLVLVYQIFIAGGSGAPPGGGGSSGGVQKVATAHAPSAPSKGPTRLKKVDVDLDKLLRNIEVVTFRYEEERISRSPMTPLVGRIRVSSEGLLGAPIGTTVYDVAQKNVTGILYSEYAPVAIVDDEVVSEGHQYADGVVLTKIEPKRVWFKWGDAEIPVELKEL